VLALLAAVAALLAIAPSALATGGGTASITGAVTDAATKAPIAGIEVCAAENLFEVQFFGMCAKTNASGEYTIANLPAGHYVVDFFAPEDSGLNYTTQYYNDKSLIEEAESLTVESGQTVSHIDAALQVGGQITGKVTNATSKAALEGIRVCAYPVTKGEGGCATSKSSGEYTISGLATGEYKLEFYPYTNANYITQFYNDKTSYGEAEPVPVTAGQTVPAIDAAMRAGGQITGKVTNASGTTGLPNIQIEVYESNGEFPIAYAATNANGEYAASGLRTGEYKVRFAPNVTAGNYVPQYYNDQPTLAAAESIEVTEEKTTPEINAKLLVGGEISGKVTSAATSVGIANIEVCATPLENGNQSCAATNPAGEYTIVGLATGEYTVAFDAYNNSPEYLEQYYDGQASLDEAQPLSVTAGSAKAGINAALLAGGEVTGTVTDSLSKAPLEGIEVCLLSSTGLYVVHCTKTNSSGEYAITDLAGGEYEVRFVSPDGAYFTQYYNGKPSSTEATVVTVTAANTTPAIDAAMVAGGHITGVVTAAAGKAPIADVEVCAENASQNVFGMCASTNSAGAYEITGLASGQYTIAFRPDNGSNYLPQYYNNKSTAAEGDLVTATDSTTVSGIDAALAGGGQITGAVTSAATKAPLAAIQVCATAAAGEPEVEGRCTTTSSTGAYTIVGLATGKYAVVFEATGEGLNYLLQYYEGKAQFSQASAVAVTAGSVTANINAAMAAGGQITGKVTGAASKAALNGIEVCAEPTSPGASGAGCSTTNAAGEYTLSDLASGEYTVSFFAQFDDDLEYEAQYYDEKSSFSEASPVSVTAGTTKSGIDAALQLKGEITGKVTSVSSKAPLSGIEVEAYQGTNVYPTAYATTNAAGEYTVFGLASGEYKVEFVVPYGGTLNYLSQYYNGKESLSAASAVSVSVGSVTGEINAALASGGEITGTVTNATTKAALGGITVCPLTTTGGFDGECVTSKANGNYKLLALATGEYKVSFSAQGSANFVPQYYNAKASSTEAGAISVTAGASTPAIDAAMVVGAKLSGTVTDAATKHAIDEMQVSAVEQGGSGRTVYARTNASGEYTIVGLATGKYTVEFSTPYGSTLNYLPQYYNGKSSASEASEISVTAGNTTSAINAAMLVGGALTGKVTDAASKTGIENIYVCLEPPGSNFFDICLDTNVNGEYTFTGLASGEYKVQFESFEGNYSTQYYNDKGSSAEANPVPVTAGKTASSIDAGMFLGGQISGTVTAAASKAGLAGIQVCASSTGAEALTRCATSGAAGEYSVDGLDTGEYRVEFSAPAGSTLNYAPQYYKDTLSFSEATLVPASSGGSTSEINAAMVSGAEIAGKVTNDSTSAPLSGIEVCPQSTNSGLSSGCVSTNASGEYTIMALQAGEYKVSFYAPPGLNFYEQYYPEKSSYSEAQALKVSAGGVTTGINAAMRVGGQITGRVSDRSNAAIAGIEVCPYTIAGGSAAGCTTTKSSGEFTLEKLPSGEYKVGFSDPQGDALNLDYIRQYYNGHARLSEGQGISVTEGKTTPGIDATLEAGGEISGKVSRIGGPKGPLAGITVCAYASSDYEPLAPCAATNSSGEYTLRGLPTGLTDVEFISYAHEYLTRYYKEATASALATPVPVQAPNVTSNIDAALKSTHPLVPEIVSAPAISGAAIEGTTLTETHGDWSNEPLAYTYQWLSCDSLGMSCLPISGATGQTYTLAAQDVGTTIAVQETASNLEGEGQPARSQPTAVIVPAKPVNQSPPAITGVQRAGQTLTETHGSWTNEPTSYEYQWERCNSQGESCVLIAGAEGQSYVLADADIAHTIRVIETAINAGGESQPAVSAPSLLVVAEVPVSVLAPAIAGSAAQGKTLLAGNGTWENEPTAYEYQWERCSASGSECAAIDGARAIEYTLSAADVGHELRVTVTARNAGGASKPAPSATTAKVVAAVPVDLTTPSISGPTLQGTKLSEIHGTWSNEPSGYSYQWERCSSSGTECKPISGATQQTYTPLGADVGRELVVEEVARNAAGPGEAAASAPSAAVVAAVPVDTTPPSIAGSARQGETLSETHGTWTNEPSSYSIEWQRCNASGESCVAASTGTSQAYELTAADLGHTIRAVEVASNAGGAGVAADSQVSATVLAAVPVAVSQPTISGVLVEGETLSENHGAWTNEPSSYAYQWERCSSMGTECKPIAGATEQTYLLQTADIGHRLLVKETASNAGGPSQAQASAATALVAPPIPVNTAAPTIAGTVRAGSTLTEQHGTWTNHPTGYTYQWEQCDSLGGSCTPIAGATAQTYTPTAADVGFTLVVQEIAHNAAGEGVPAVSLPTSIVVPEIPANSSRPSISGTPQTGQTLLVAHGAWSNQPTQYGEQWLRCDASGENCQPLHDEINLTYVPSAADVGHTLEVAETATNAGGTSASALSLPTAVVTIAPLLAAAGEDAETTIATKITFDGSGSTPASEITAYHWDFGDGSSSSEEIATHSYSVAGRYTATLKVSRGGEVSEQSITVTVTPPPPRAAVVTVEDSESDPLAGAEVLYDGAGDTKVEASTAASGEAKLAGLPDGTDTVYVYKHGFKPAVGQITVSEGGGAATVTLTSGEVATSKLDAHEMDLHEIEAAGINPAEPGNSLVTEFEVSLATVGGLHCYVNERSEFVGSCSGPNITSCGAYSCEGEGFVAFPTVIEGHPLIQWLVLGGKASFLKQFFSVSMIVQNLSPEPFKLTGGSAALTVPPGMSLAPTPTPQQATQAVPDIPGLASSTSTWIVRGDAEGEYYLSASYHGELQPFNAPVELEAKLASPLHVWGASALKFHVQADSGSLGEGVPYHVRVGLEDVADIPLYNLALAINPNKHANFIYQPGQEYEANVGELKPGETVYAPRDILVPDANSAGSFDPALSSAHFVGQEIHPGAGIEAVAPPPLYTMTSTLATATMIHLHWQPSPGAQGYEVFSTPNLDTPFAASPEAVQLSRTDTATVTRLPATDTDAYIPRGLTEPARFYAVTTLIGGQLQLQHPVSEPSLQGPVGGPLTLGELLAGGNNLAEACSRCASSRMGHGDPVDAPTGNFWHSFTDLDIPGRGIALDLTRTYNSATADTNGALGYGWSFAYGMSLTFPDAEHVTVNQENGAQVTFTKEPEGKYAAPPRVTATLVHNADGSWSFVRRRRERFTFNSSGRLSTETDLNGYTTSLAYSGAGQLETVTDPAGRKLTFAYTGGHITAVTDPLGRVVHYSYDAAGDLTDVTDVAGGDTHFTYDAAHRMLTMRTPDQAPGVSGATGAAVANVYNSDGRVIEQTDQLGRTTKFSYSGEPLSATGGTTTITDPKGNVTVQSYKFGELLSETQGAGTPEAASWKFEYDQSTLGLTSLTDPDSHTTRATYDAEGNTLSSEDALGRKTVNTYDALNDLLTSIDPSGVTTTMTYDAHGNLLTKSRPLNGSSAVQRTTYTYGDSAHPGDVTAVTDADGNTWQHTYDANGDRTATTDPLAHRTTSTYNAIGWLLSATSPRGNVSGANPASFTTTYAHNAFGLVTETVDPLGHKTTRAYDPDQNLVASTDADGNTTHYLYDAADEQIAVVRADGSTTHTTYWPDGTIEEQIDAAGHATRYDYDALARPSAVTDPLGRVTHYGYDPAGNETSMTDAEGQLTTKTYDADNELTSISYSDGKTPDVKDIAYNADGERTAMTDGSGTSTFAYDSLNRMTSSTDGAGATVDYEYDLVGHPTKLTYPNGKSVTRDYNAAGSLTSVTDWLGHTTSFAYDADANETGAQYPNSVNASTVYDAADQISSITDTNGASTLASFAYTRDAAGLISGEKADNGSETTSTFTHNTLDQLSSENTNPYGYDASENPTTFAATAQTFDAANELTSNSTPVTPSESNEEKGKEEKGKEETHGETSKEAPQETPKQQPEAGPKGGSGEGPSGHSAVEAFQGSGTPPVPTDATVSGSSHGHTGKLTSPKLTTHDADDLVLAFISASSGRRVKHVTGDGLKWSQLASSDTSHGVAEIWQARATRKLQGPVSAQLNASGPAGITVAAFSGRGANVVAHASSHGRSSAPTLQLHAPAGTSVWAVGAGSGQQAQTTAAAGQRLVWQFFEKRAHDSGWVQQTTAGAAATHIADTTTAANWGLAAIVIAAGQAHAAQVASAPAAVALSSRTNVGSVAGASASATSATAAASATTAASATRPAERETAKSAARPATETVARQFTYNARGDRTAQSTAGGSTLDLSYDQADRLIGVGSTVSYAYNGDGLRVSKDVNGTTSHFVWNQTQATPELLGDGATDYIYGPYGEAIEQISASTATYLLQDQQGSTRLLTDDAGNVIGRYNYDAWGKVASHAGNAVSNLQYDGQYTDAETGYQYLRARYYDPTSGQFLTTDPIVSLTLSRYGFADNDPLRYGDPTGRWFGLDTLIGTVVGATVGTVVGAASYGFGVVTGSQQFSWRGLGGSVAGGFVGGAVAGACEGTTWVGTAACGALGGVAGTATTDWVGGQPITAEGLLEGGAFGALGGVGGKLVGDDLGPAGSAAWRDVEQDAAGSAFEVYGEILAGQFDAAAQLAC
jgi:RHS repeat-associated protein